MKRSSSRKMVSAAAVAVLLCVVGSVAQARVVLASRGLGLYRNPSTLEFVFEAALAEPQGNQQDDFWTTADGFGSGTGYQVGMRLRHYLTETFAVSPAIHYLRFGTASGVADSGIDAGLGYEIRTSNYRFGLDFQAFMGDSAALLRPYVTGGVALANNRYRDEIQYSGAFEASVNAPVYSFGVGLRAQNLELVGEYTINRFDTNKFDYEGLTRDYNWDYLVVRVGFAFGR